MAATGVSGAEEFVRLAKHLAVADKELRKQLLRRIRDAGKPVAHDMKAGLRAQLPNKGGLANRGGRAPVGIRTRAAGKQAGIRIQASGSKKTLTARTLKGLDESGSWRHPVFGDRKKWAGQTEGAVQGWFTEQAEDAKPEMQREILAAMHEITEQIVKGI